MANKADPRVDNDLGRLPGCEKYRSQLISEQMVAVLMALTVLMVPLAVALLDQDMVLRATIVQPLIAA